MQRAGSRLVSANRRPAADAGGIRRDRRPRGRGRCHRPTSSELLSQIWLCVAARRSQPSLSADPRDSQTGTVNRRQCQCVDWSRHLCFLRRLQSLMRISIPNLSLVVLIGPSGSGKSTFARKHFLPTEVLSSDACRGMVSDDENNQAVTKRGLRGLALHRRQAAGAWAG